MFEVGQKVWDILEGEGVVDAIESNTPYPVVVKFAAGDVVITYMTNGKSYVANKNPSLYPYPVEVVRKAVKPSINWDAVDERFNYLAVDADGSAYLYSDIPELCLTFKEWEARSRHCTKGLFKVENLGLCDWKDSLISRP